MESLTGLSKNYPGFANELSRVKPRDIDEYIQYGVFYPEVGTTCVITATNGTSVAGTVARNFLDYPRSLLVGWADDSGTALVGTVTIDGKDQFGEVITETFVNTTGGTTNVQGTKVFDYVGTVTIASTGGAAGDAVTVGVGIAAGTAKFGLPNKVMGSADVLRYNWIDNGSSKEGTCTIDKVNHAFIPAAAVAAADCHIVVIRPKYTTNDDHECQATNSDLISNA